MADNLIGMELEAFTWEQHEMMGLVELGRQLGPDSWPWKRFDELLASFEAEANSVNDAELAGKTVNIRRKEDGQSERPMILKAA